MRPASPIIPGKQLTEVVIGSRDPNVMPLPAFCYDDGSVLSRWHLTWRERLLVLLFGNIYHWQETHGGPIYPIAMQVEKPVCEE